MGRGAKARVWLCQPERGEWGHLPAGRSEDRRFVSPHGPPHIKMFVLSNLIDALAQVIGLALTFYMWVIIARALISWVNPDPYNPVVQFLYKVTEPVLHPIRRMMGSYSIGIDLSPLIAIFIIIFLQNFLVASLHHLARKLQ